MRADNGINGTGIAAMRATDTQRLINDRDRSACGRGLCKCERFLAEQLSEPLDRSIAPGGAQINGRV
jgi:hypothetical protein